MGMNTVCGVTPRVATLGMTTVGSDSVKIVIRVRSAAALTVRIFLSLFD